MNSMIILLYFFLNFNCIQGTTVSGTTFKYLGCFKDKPAPNRALPHSHKHDFTNSVEVCGEECAGYKYFGLQASIECWCGNSGYDKYGPAPWCYYPCTGDLKETCGAIHVNSVYEITSINATTTDGATVTTAPSRMSLSAPVPNDVSTTPHHRAMEWSGVEIGGVVAGVVVCATVILVVVLVTVKCKAKGKNKLRGKELEDELTLGQRQNSYPAGGSNFIFSC